MNRLTRIVIVTMVAISGSTAAVFGDVSVASAKDYGPDTCRYHYVWREAVPGDHVCVDPATRASTRADNSSAAQRREPAGSPDGPDACRQGYVWRDAVPGDRVCVTPQTHDRAQVDNAHADARRLSVRIWLSRWYPDPACDRRACSSTSTASVPRLQVNGDHFNNKSKVKIVVVKVSGRKQIASYVVTAKSPTLSVGGVFNARTNVVDCSSSVRRPDNAYIQAQDVRSGRWSNRLPINTECRVL